MRKILYTHFVLSFLILSSPFLKAQTPLPYYTGFDNTQEQSGWQEFRTGYIGTYSFGYVSSNSFSPPNSLFHDYEVGGSSTDTIIDWFVSPPFDFSTGGEIDSLKINLFAFSVTPVDYCGIYVLVGSPNPDLATSQIEITDLTSLASAAGLWSNVGDFLISPTSGTCYIAIKLRITSNWFTPFIDNIYIIGNTTGTPELSENSILKVFPNPANDYLNVEGIVNDDIAIYDYDGKSVLIVPNSTLDNKIRIDISQLSTGIYFVGLTDKNSQNRIKFVKK